jgi:hypothetical protein
MDTPYMQNIRLGARGSFVIEALSYKPEVTGSRPDQLNYFFNYLIYRYI